MSDKAVFLDRDGTLIVDRVYLCNPEGVELLPGAEKALERLQAKGFLLLVVSNQSAVARGICTTGQVDAVNARMAELFGRAGVRFASIRYCPHMPDAGCACRKPAPGMLLDAAAEHDIDLDRSAIVGDKETDVAAGVAAGCGLNILLGHAQETVADIVAPDLSAAVRSVISALG